jgi:hypothetical protein
MVRCSRYFTRVFSEASLADWLSKETTADVSPPQSLTGVCETSLNPYRKTIRIELLTKNHRDQPRIPRIEITAATSTVSERRFQAYCGASVRVGGSRDDVDGKKHVLGLREGATENAAARTIPANREEWRLSNRSQPEKVSAIAMYVT